MPLLFHRWFHRVNSHVPMFPQKSQCDTVSTNLIDYHTNYFIILPFLVYKLLHQYEKHSYHHMPHTHNCSFPMCTVDQIHHLYVIISNFINMNSVYTQFLCLTVPQTPLLQRDLMHPTTNNNLFTKTFISL